ncbi:MAG TPA: hypothetical protein PLV68_03380, partial [Ilumatobacteraceae bacterium]|nr:hypothetical protein [Ilumatobacteraceae bacterium]
NALVKRRIRTLTEQLLNPDVVAARVAELTDLIEADAAADRAVWHTYGSQQTARYAAGQIISNYVVPQYQRLLGSFANSGRIARWPQPEPPAVSMAVDHATGIVTITNHSGDSVDISQFRIDGIGLVVPGGTVLLPGRSARYFSDSAASLVGLFGAAPGGVYTGSLADNKPLELVTRAGTMVARDARLAPGKTTTIKGSPNRSAVISIIATETGAPGYLQVLACGTAPGATSNLNADRAGQTVAGLAVIRFDAKGEACVYNQSVTHVVVDLQGYLATAAFDDIADVRLVDTRNGPRPEAGTQVTITATPNRSAVVSLISVDNAAPGYLQVLPCGDAPGATSNLNTSRAGQIAAGLA